MDNLIIVAMAAAPQLSQDAMLARQVTGGELSAEQMKQLKYQREVCIWGYNRTVMVVSSQFHCHKVLTLTIIESI